MSDERRHAEPLSKGDRVIDRDDTHPSPAVIIDLPTKTAEEVYIEALGETVAAANPDYDPTDPVATIAFERDFDRHGDDAQTYCYPVSRLTHLSETEMPRPQSEGERKRAEIAETYPAAVAAFEAVCRRIIAEPNETAAALDALAVPDGQPPTRGECDWTSSDKYRPGDPEAIVCWHCSAGRRPMRYQRSAPVPSEAPCQAEPTESIADGLASWADHDGVAVNPEYAVWNLRYDLDSLRSDTDRAVRRGAVRLAYNTTLGGHVPKYSLPRALALLRDRGVNTDALLPGGDPW